jgi:4-amino-4-deoxy-L-arabinose transferase-like glycosyltransferase
MTASTKAEVKGNAGSVSGPADAKIHAAPGSQSRSSKVDTLYIPLALAIFFFTLYLLTATGFHTFDGIAYIRDMGKPLAAMVLPHHLIYEPAVLAFYRLWQALGWTGRADMPAQMLSSLAGAGGLAVLYKTVWEWSRVRAVALLTTLALALTYGYWFYSVEVEIYVPPLFFLLVATWLLARLVQGGPDYLCYLMGLSQGVATTIHQGSLFIVPAFALGIFLAQGSARARVGRVIRYGLALAGLVAPAYLFAGMVIAGQNTPDTFLKWINNYGHLGTWGVWRKDSLEATISGLSAALSAEFWTGRLLMVVMLALPLARAVRITKRGGPFAWALWVWFAIYGVFFAWWQPENLKFWVLMIPAPLLLMVLAFDWKGLNQVARRLAMAGAGLCVALLAVTNAPVLWEKRDPMSDPARRMSQELGRISGPEDLIVLQAGSAESYLPFLYQRENVMSTRELWYLMGGAHGRGRAVQAIRQRIWHSLAKGSSVWLEERALLTGEQTSDHYVFSRQEVDQLLSPYGERAVLDRVTAGPEPFYRLSPDKVYSAASSWEFAADQEGWSGVNIAGEAVAQAGWCFTPQNDPAVYGPPIRAQADRIEVRINSGLAGRAQLFYRADVPTPYAEENSASFNLVKGDETYTIDLPRGGNKGTIQGLRLDPIEKGDAAAGTDNIICVRSIRLLQP